MSRVLKFSDFRVWGAIMWHDKFFMERRKHRYPESLRIGMAAREVCGASLQVGNRESM